MVRRSCRGSCRARRQLHAPGHDEALERCSLLRQEIVGIAYADAGGCRGGGGIECGVLQAAFDRHAQVEERDRAPRRQGRRALAGLCRERQGSEVERVLGNLQLRGWLQRVDVVRDHFYVIGGEGADAVGAAHGARCEL